MRELRGQGCIDRQQADGAVRHAAQQCFEAVNVHRFSEHILHDFAHQGMIRNFDVAFNVLLAGSHIGKHCGVKIVGADAEDWRGNLLPIAVSQQSERTAGIPAPTRLENRRIERCLLQHLLHSLLSQKLEDLRQWEAVLLGQGDVQAIFGGRGLQFEIKRAAEALAQRESPGLVDPRTQRSMDY